MHTASRCGISCRTITAHGGYSARRLGLVPWSVVNWQSITTIPEQPTKFVDRLVALSPMLEARLQLLPGVRSYKILESLST